MAVAPGPTGLGAVQAPMPLVFRQPEAALLDCSGQLMSDLSSVTQQIERAFADVDYPGDWCLVNSLEGEEPALLEREFKGRDDWRVLDAAFLDQAPDGYGSALSFFSDEAFHFYLPAYLIADLAGQLEHADPLFHLTHGLDRSSRGKKINPLRYGERTWADYARYRFSMFNARECAAIAAYLRSRRDKGDLTSMETEIIDQALERYWDARGR